MPPTNLGRLQACLDYLGIKVHTTVFDEKLVAQKLTDILQEMGIRLGYEGTFGFHVRGRYSPTLTKDLYAAADSSGLVMVPPARLKPADVEKLDRLKAALEPRPNLVEVISTYRYYRSKGATQDDAVRLVKQKKPFISERDIALGVSKAKMLFPEFTAQDQADLDLEMQPWDKLAAS